MCEIEDSPFEFIEDIICSNCNYSGLHIKNHYWRESLRCGRCGHLILPVGVIE